MADDLYSGFNDYNSLTDTQTLLNDQAFQQAVARTSHGRRPMTGKVGGRLATAQQNARGRTALGTARPGTASQGGTARPMTAVRGAGYSSREGSAGYDPLKNSGSTASDTSMEQNPEEKCRQVEKKVFELLEESILAHEKGDLKKALEKAKDAGKKERSVVKLREQLGSMEQLNLDLTFSVLFNLAHQYTASNLYNEALNTYQVIVKNKTFSNGGRLKVNIGNIYFKKKDYNKAIKHYRMALDQIPNVQKQTRIKILNNIGVAFVRLGKYDEAISTFEHCMEEKPEFKTGLNLILCSYTMEDKDKMKDAFERLLDIPPDVEDDDKYNIKTEDPQENLVLQAISNDSLRQWERQRKQQAERTILTAARLVSPIISSNFSEGYAWCVEQIKQSAYADLATDLELNKAIQYLKQRDLNSASEVLKAFSKKDTKVASVAANNLSFVCFLENNYDEATAYADQAINADHYNPAPYVNRGNVCFAQGEYDHAREMYREALNNEASCVEALFNMGLASKRMDRLDEALGCFEKLHAIFRNSVQVVCQIASIYEELEDTSNALEWYSLAQNMAPTDPGILAKLGELYDNEGDKSQAFQCHYDSYRYFPSNIDVIEWLGAYYIDAQFPEKAVNYFEKAALIQKHPFLLPILMCTQFVDMFLNNPGPLLAEWLSGTFSENVLVHPNHSSLRPGQVRWQLMIASCHRRSGNYQKALETYKTIHRRFPDNIECLKFLVRLSNDLRLPEADEYANKLKKAEKAKELREQRSTDSSGGAGGSRSALSRGTVGSASGRPGSSRSLRTASSARSKINFDGVDANAPYEITNKKPIDTSYEDPIGPAPERPKTAAFKRNHDENQFQDEELDDDLLPE